MNNQKTNDMQSMLDKEIEMYKKAVKEVILNADKRFEDRQQYIISDDENQNTAQLMNIATLLKTQDILNGVYSRLNMMFRQNKIYNTRQAQEAYDNLVNFEARYHKFIQLVDDIIQIGVPLIPDKLLFCAFMRITNSYYKDLLDSPNEDMRNLMESIEEYLVGFKQTSAETGQRKGTVVQKGLSMKDFGHSVQYADNDAPKSQPIFVVGYNEVKKVYDELIDLTNKN